MLSESTLRRRAYKIGCQVVKGFTHFRDHVWYDCNGNRSAGYMVRDMSSGCYVWGGYDSNGFDFLWDLSDVEDYLKESYKNLGLEW